MKNLVLVVVLALFGSQIANAKITTSAEVFALGVDADQGMITPDYFTKLGDVSIYGFIEIDGGGGWFSNHTMTWMPTKYLGLYTEASLNDSDQFSTSIGPAFSIPLRGFTYLKVRPTAVIGDLERTRELNLVWKSKSLKAFGGEVWTEGFIRTLRDAGHTYGQPQVWYKRSNSPWHFGVEIEVDGSNRTARGGLKRVF